MEDNKSNSPESKEPNSPKKLSADDIIKILDEKRSREEDGGESMLPEDVTDSVISQVDEEIDEDDVFAEDEDYEEVISAPKKKRKKKTDHGKIIFGIILTMVIVVIALLLSALIIKVGKEYLEDKLESSIAVEIPVVRLSVTLQLS